MTRPPVFTVLDSVWRSGAEDDLCSTRLPDPSTSMEITLEEEAAEVGLRLGEGVSMSPWVTRVLGKS